MVIGNPTPQSLLVVYTSGRHEGMDRIYFWGPRHVSKSVTDLVPKDLRAIGCIQSLLGLLVGAAGLVIHVR